MTKVRQALGEWGERLAAAHLAAAGMVLLDRNWRTSAGEIDIVARDGEAVVFCEQKLQDLRQRSIASSGQRADRGMCGRSLKASR